MVLGGKPLTAMPLPTVVCGCDIWMHDFQNSQSAFVDHIWSRCDVDVWLVTSESSQFIFVAGCAKVVNSVKFSRAFLKIPCPQTFSIWWWTHIWTAWKQSAFGSQSPAKDSQIPLLQLSYNCSYQGRAGRLFMQGHLQFLGPDTCSRNWRHNFHIQFQCRCTTTFGSWRQSTTLM